MLGKHHGALLLQIDEWTAFSGELSVQISGHYMDMKGLKENLAKATAIRKKELAEFNAHEQELLDTIEALKKAIAMLGKHHGALLQQADESQLMLLQHMVHKHTDLVKSALTGQQHRVLVSFLQRDSDDAFVQQPPGKSYAPQSGEILGILKQMLEEFERDLSTAQKDELSAQSEYEQLKASIMDELTPTPTVCGVLAITSLARSRPSITLEAKSGRTSLLDVMSVLDPLPMQLVGEFGNGMFSHFDPVPVQVFSPPAVLRAHASGPVGQAAIEVLCRRPLTWSSSVAVAAWWASKTSADSTFTDEDIRQALSSNMVICSSIPCLFCQGILFETICGAIARARVGSSGRARPQVPQRLGQMPAASQCPAVAPKACPLSDPRFRSADRQHACIRPSNALVARSWWCSTRRP